jgi:hypothetical protein
LKRRSPLIVSAAALLALAGIAAWKLSAVMGDQRPSQDTQAPATGQVVASPRISPGLPLPPGTFDQTRTELERRARHGDGNAAYRLADAIAKCLTYQPISENELTNMLASAVAKGTGMLGGHAMGDDANIDLILYAHAEMERVCAGTDDLRLHPPSESAFHWMERAAQAGHPRAMSEFGTHAFTEFKSAHDLVEQAALVSARRNLASSYLDSALAAHEPSALLEAAKTHDNGFVADDPQAALTYWLAYRNHPSFDLPESIASRLDEQYLQRAPASSRSEAAQRAKRLLEQPRWSLQ